MQCFLELKIFTTITRVYRARILGSRDVLAQFGSVINLTCRAEKYLDTPESVVWYKNEEGVDNF